PRRPKPPADRAARAPPVAFGLAAAWAAPRTAAPRAAAWPRLGPAAAALFRARPRYRSQSRWRGNAPARRRPAEIPGRASTIAQRPRYAAPARCGHDRLLAARSRRPA